MDSIIEGEKYLKVVNAGSRHSPRECLQVDTPIIAV